MKLNELIKKPTFQNIINYCLERAVWAIIAFLFSVVVIKGCLSPLMRFIGSSRPLLFATVKCESWKVPWCVDVDKGVKRPESIVHPNDIKCVLCAESMYIIKVLNKGSKEAANPNLTIEGNLYSEVIREIGKGSPNTPEEHFKPKEIKLGLIQPRRSVNVNAWVAESSSRSCAEQIKITCEGLPASLDIVHPCRRITQLFDQYFWSVIVLTPIVLMLFHLFIRMRQKNTIVSKKAKP